ncbi:MAG: type IX secretion system membrane protein PorP/SprF [Flavobacteriales bacterium]|nr:type IX secretion system membrane protein PorP/SprF [Flavobacteriales bacterium]
MKKLLLLIGLVIGSRATAQQISQYTQYVFNHFSINPGVAGSKDCLDVRLGYRRQWVGFENAPVTAWASLHGVIKPKGKPYQQNRHGVGAFVEADDTGPIGYTQFLLAYAYHIQMNKDSYMSLGFFGGMKQFKLDVSDLTLNNYNDPILDAKRSTMIYPVITPGIWFYSKSGWAGLSIHQVLGNRITDVGEDSRLARQFLASAGYRYRFSKTFSMVPSTLLKLGPATPLAFDINAMFEYKKRLGFGIGYRNQDAVSFMIKLPFLNYFTLGYSYDVTTSRLRVASSNTHEVILAIYPCKANDPSKTIVSCPVFE